MTYFWILIKNEMLIIYRHNMRQTLSNTLMLTIMHWVLLKHLITHDVIASGQNQQLGHILTAPMLSLMYAPLLLVSYLANALLLRSFTQEHTSGAIMPMFATGIHVGMLWAVKTFAMFIYCFLISIIILQVDILLMVSVFKKAVALSCDNIIIIFGVTPIITLALVVILSFIYWAVKTNYFVASLVPMATTMALCYYTYTHTTTVPLHGALAVAIIGGGIIFTCGLIITRISKERILRLE